MPSVSHIGVFLCSPLALASSRLGGSLAGESAPPSGAWRSFAAFKSGTYLAGLVVSWRRLSRLLASL